MQELTTLLSCEFKIEQITCSVSRGLQLFLPTDGSHRGGAHGRASSQMVLSYRCCANQLQLRSPLWQHGYKVIVQLLSVCMEI